MAQALSDKSHSKESAIATPAQPAAATTGHADATASNASATHTCVSLSLSLSLFLVPSVNQE